MGPDADTATVQFASGRMIVLPDVVGVQVSVPGAAPSESKTNWLDEGARDKVPFKVIFPASVNSRASVPPKVCSTRIDGLDDERLETRCKSAPVASAS